MIKLMNLKNLSVFLFTLLAAARADARPMITDLSDRNVKITAKFSGKDILLYGARVEAGNIVIVIRGPDKKYIVRKKENIHGLWVNTESVEFKEVPEFYQIASSSELSKLEADNLLEKLGIGFNTVKFRSNNKDSADIVAEFEEALKTKKEADRLFYFETINLPFLEGTLFRMHINFPSKISDGIYMAEIYSFSDGQLTGMQSIPIEAKKSGIEALIYNTAHDEPMLYGLGSILIAVATGLFAGRFLKRA